MKNVLFLTIAVMAATLIIAPPILWEGKAATGGPLFGRAWSSNIGWVILNCASANPPCNPSDINQDFKVQAQDDGRLTGYAWSSAIGWIKFDPDQTPPGEAGPNPARINVNTGEVTGWIRACSVFVDQSATGCQGALKSNDERGGWDGWIRMSQGPNYASPYAPNTTAGTPGSWDENLDGWADAGGVTYDGEFDRLRGLAWGGDVVGWLNFDASTPTTLLDTITITLASTPPVGDLVADGGGGLEFKAALDATVTNNVGEGDYTYTFDCDTNSASDPLYTPPPTSSTTVSTPPDYCEYNSARQFTAKVEVRRNGARRGEATVGIRVKPPIPKFREVGPQ